MNPVCLRIPPDEEVYEASRPLGVLPNLVAKSAGLIFADIRHKLVYRCEALIECFWSNLVSSKLVYLVWVALDVRHTRLLGLVATQLMAPRCEPPNVHIERAPERAALQEPNGAAVGRSNVWLGCTV